MKNLLYFISIVYLGFSLSAYASTQQTPTGQASTKMIIAATCPTNCSSCWDQCTKSDECGVGHKCVASACGNRCTAE